MVKRKSYSQVPTPFCLINSQTPQIVQLTLTSNKEKKLVHLLMSWKISGDKKEEIPIKFDLKQFMEIADVMHYHRKAARFDDQGMR